MILIVKNGVSLKYEKRVSNKNKKYCLHLYLQLSTGGFILFGNLHFHQTEAQERVYCTTINTTTTAAAAYYSAVNNNFYYSYEKTEEIDTLTP